MSRTMRDDPRFAELVGKFCRRAVGEAEQLEQALADGDRERVRFLAHSLAGAAGTFGFTELSELARPLDEAAAAGADQQWLEELATPLLKALAALPQPR